MINAKRSIEACAAFYGDDSKDMKNYLLEGEKAALGINNRGPISFDAQGNLAASIRNAYSENGFYIFEGVLNKDELDDIKVDLDKMRSNFPIHPESAVDINGGTCSWSRFKSFNFGMVKTLRRSSGWN